MVLEIWQDRFAPRAVRERSVPGLSSWLVGPSSACVASHHLFPVWVSVPNFLVHKGTHHTGRGHPWWPHFTLLTSMKILWGLILCVSWTGLGDEQTRFWVCLWGWFWKRLACESVEGRRCPSQVSEWSSCSSLRAPTEQKGRGGLSLLFSLALGPPSSALAHGHSWFSSPRTPTRMDTISPWNSLDENWITPPVFLALQCVDHRSWDFSASVTWFLCAFSLSFSAAHPLFSSLYLSLPVTPVSCMSPYRIICNWLLGPILYLSLHTPPKIQSQNRQ